jgi:uroporphyrinogen-III decarboxylase
MRGDPAYIFNLGHGIRPDTPPAAVHTLLTLLKTTS